MNCVLRIGHSACEGEVEKSSFFLDSQWHPFLVLPPLARGRREPIRVRPVVNAVLPPQASIVELTEPPLPPLCGHQPQPGKRLRSVHRHRLDAPRRVISPIPGTSQPVSPSDSGSESELLQDFLPVAVSPTSGREVAESIRRKRPASSGYVLPPPKRSAHRTRSPRFTPPSPGRSVDSSTGHLSENGLSLVLAQLATMQDTNRREMDRIGRKGRAERRQMRKYCCLQPGNSNQQRSRQENHLCFPVITGLLL